MSCLVIGYDDKGRVLTSEYARCVSDVLDAHDRAMEHRSVTIVKTMPAGDAS